MNDDAPRGDKPRDEPPPILGSWPALYTALLIYLALLIALLAWFTRAFA